LLLFPSNEVSFLILKGNLGIARSLWFDMTDTKPHPLIEAIMAKKNGIVVDIEVSAGARATGIKGFNQWRKRIEVAVGAPPVKGAANKEVIELFARTFCVPRTEVEIISGHKASLKSVAVYGITSDEAYKALKEAIES
jgi:uncharacterized protein (TIGR00251 family)